MNATEIYLLITEVGKTAKVSQPPQDPFLNLVWQVNQAPTEIPQTISPPTLRRPSTKHSSQSKRLELL